MNVYRIANPTAFTVPGIVNLALKVLEKEVQKDKVCAALAALTTSVDSPYTGLFVGEENGEFRALALMFLPPNALHTTPQWHGLYNFGSEALGKAVVSEVVKFCQQNGYNKFSIISRSGTNSEVYGRKWAWVGKTKTLGTMVEFTLAAE